MNYCTIWGGLDGQRENVRWKCRGPSFYNTAAVARRTVKNGCHAEAASVVAAAAASVKSWLYSLRTSLDSRPSSRRLPPTCCRQLYYYPRSTPNRFSVKTHATTNIILISLLQDLVLI